MAALLRLVAGCIFALLLSLPSSAAITYFGSAISTQNTASNSTPPITVTPPANMQSGQLVYVTVVLRDGTAPVSITNTGGQVWTTESRFANGVSSSISVFWCIFNGRWTGGNPTFATDLPSLSAAFGAVMAVFSPTGGFSIAEDRDLITGTVNTPIEPYDIVASGQTPSVASSVSLFSWEVAIAKRFALQTAGFANPGGIQQSQWQNAAASAGATLSLAYKIQSSVAPTGNVTNRITNGDKHSATRWTAHTFKEVAATASGRKFHPGHYAWAHCGWNWQLDPDPNQEKKVMPCLKALIDEIQPHDEIEGILVRQWWAAYEGATEGSYAAGIAKVRELVNYAKARGKRVALNVHPIQFGGFGPLTEIFPQYIVTGQSYGTTEFNVEPYDGVTARVWQVPTNERLIELARAYGAEFDRDPWVEWWEPGGETSINVTRGTDGYSIGALKDRLEELFTGARAAWPNTGIRLHANFLGSDQQMQDVLDACEALGCIIGGPDTLPNQWLQANQLYRGYRTPNPPPAVLHDLKMRMPFASEVQSPELCGKEGTYTAPQLYSWAWTGGNVNTKDPNDKPIVLPVPPVDPSYFVWYVNWECKKGTPQQWDNGADGVPGIKAFILSNPTPLLRDACPGSYTTGCNRN